MRPSDLGYTGCSGIGTDQHTENGWEATAKLARFWL